MRSGSSHSSATSATAVSGLSGAGHTTLYSRKPFGTMYLQNQFRLAREPRFKGKKQHRANVEVISMISQL